MKHLLCYITVFKPPEAPGPIHSEYVINEVGVLKQGTHYVGLLRTVFIACQPLLVVNLSPEFVNLYFPYADMGLLFFLRVAAAF